MWYTKPLVALGTLVCALVLHSVVDMDANCAFAFCDGAVKSVFN